MKTSRREFLVLAGVAGAVAGCNQLAKRLPGDELPASTALPEGDVHPVVRLLNRAGYGPRPGDVAEVQRMGLEAWVDSQLEAGSSKSKLDQHIEESARLQWQLARLDVWQQAPGDLLDMQEDEIVRQLNQMQLLRATYGKWQIKERMAGFWADHFNVYARKGRDAERLGKYETEALRDHSLGKFSDLLKTVAHSPAMLAYLDNQLNVNGVANENYARELMELHTLGVHGGYSQKDVQEVARCFTGWTFERRFLHRVGEFRFDDDLHDKGEKVVLGHRIPAGGGQSDAEQVLDIVANHPATAEFIAGKMCRHFLGDTDHPMRAELASTFTQCGGDIKATLRPLFLSRVLLEGPPIAKRPVDFLVSALRATGANSDCGPAIQEHLGHMGQPLFEWPMPDGYPDRAAAWSGSLLARWNFAIALAHDKVGGTSANFEELAKRSGIDDHREALQAVLLNKPGKLPHAMDPSRTVPEVAALCLATPEFQLR